LLRVNWNLSQLSPRIGISMPRAAPAQFQFWKQQERDLGDDDGGDHEVMPAQPETGIAERHRDQRRD
jgi:hypothetical protein